MRNEKRHSLEGGNPALTERRSFLLGLARSAGAAAVGGLVWAGFIDGKKAYPTVLRPPGAVEEARFLAKCTKCGLCAEACPYDALIMAKPGDGRPVGTPYFLMREDPCRMCQDIPCAAECPTGALAPALVSGPDDAGIQRLDINLARIGLAVIDRETCIAYWGIQCEACYRACPVIDRAITVEHLKNDRTGKHAILGPVVHSEHCTGCGLCEHACVTRKASIFVLPRELALGEPSEHYVRGWDAADEKRIEDAAGDVTTTTPRSKKDPLEYLNQEGF
ncbi:MAG: ferredoxin-type protein NapG [Nitrospirae bacterium GWC2_57_13]|nr:MAG: ferredoxin-type protein NapG [Nitrospirae bacterium GWC2_57_13]OGW42396.1 MAG: ferredoxin-type protein NapG [Nitrospirae bacterium GWD2_57_8]